MDDLTSSIRKLIADDLAAPSDDGELGDEQVERPAVRERTETRRLPALETRIGTLVENAFEAPAETVEPARPAPAGLGTPEPRAVPAASLRRRQVPPPSAARRTVPEEPARPGPARRTFDPAPAPAPAPVAREAATGDNPAGWTRTAATMGTGARPAAAEEAERAGAGEPLTSESTRQSVGRSLDALSRSVLTQNPRTFEGLVGDLLRPMLREWLDANLGRIVEDEVRREIERTTRRAR